MQKIVDVQNIEKIYGKAGEKQFKALSDVNFEVKPGEFVGIMGASGSGKTTLLNILSTLDTPTSGRVEIAGQDITKLKTIKWPISVPIKLVSFFKTSTYWKI
jgi:ABC-type antimicrobial peptide transport system, ATPase component